MKTYKVYHEEIEEGIPVRMKPNPHIYVGDSDNEYHRKEIPLIGSIDSMITDRTNGNSRRLKDIEIVKKEEGYIITPISSSSDLNNLDDRILVRWSLTSPGYGDAEIHAEKDVEVLTEVFFTHEELAIPGIIAILRRKQKLRAITRQSDSRTKKWTLSYNGKLPIVTSGRWKGKSSLFWQTHHWYP